MRSPKTAAVIISLCLTAFLGMATTAKTATVEQTTQAIHQKIDITSISNLDVAKQDEVICSALNLYHEVRGQSEESMIAVAMATRNRASKKHTSICNTVWEKNQFIWTRFGPSRIIPTEVAAWDTSLKISVEVLTNSNMIDPTGGADSFYSKKLNPRWARKGPRIVIGPHVFVSIYPNTPKDEG